MQSGGNKLTLKVYHLPFLAHLITARDLLQEETMSYFGVNALHHTIKGRPTERKNAQERNGVEEQRTSIGVWQLVNMY